MVLCRRHGGRGFFVRGLVSNMGRVIIPVDTINAVIAYLATQPYREVAPLIDALRQQAVALPEPAAAPALIEPAALPVIGPEPATGK